MDPDLFGAFAVSQADIDLWLRLVARLEPDSPRRATYARHWNVAEKIAAAKARDEWPPERL